MIEIANLELRHPGISEAWAALLLEAASVCLSRHHTSPSDLTVLEASSGHSFTAGCEWPSVGFLVSWRNKDEATEFGACAVGIASIEYSKKLFVVARAETGDGADYYLAAKPADMNDLEDCIRLEVSGSDNGDLAAMMTRLRTKLSQLSRGKSGSFGLATVIGFREKTVLVAEHVPT